MASDLLVALASGGAIEQIHAFDDGVLSEFAFDLDQRLLYVPFGLSVNNMPGFALGSAARNPDTTRTASTDRDGSSGIVAVVIQLGEQVRLRICIAA